MYKMKLPQPNYDQISFATIPVPSNKMIASNRMKQGVNKTQIIDKSGSLPRVNLNHSSLLHNNSGLSVEGDDEYENDFEAEAELKNRRVFKS
jgi:hypothetical protein